MPRGEKDAAEDFLKLHSAQLQGSGIPGIYWNTLFGKLRDEVYDAGNDFQIMKVLYEDEEDDSEDDSSGSSYGWMVVVSKEDGISPHDPQHIYLTDHAWTYQVSDARCHLEKIPSLADRMAKLMDISLEDRSKEAVIGEILKEKWRFNQTYRFGNTEMGSAEAMPLWYILDEFGSKIQHSNNPSFRAVPFYYVPARLGITVLWPLQYVECGGEVTRNYAENVQDPLKQRAKLIPWVPQDMTDVDYHQVEPDISYFLTHKVKEIFPESVGNGLPELPRDCSIRVYIDYSPLSEHLTDPRFEVVDTPDQADVIWTRTPWKDYGSLMESDPPQYINQFPNESVVTVKDLLCVTARRMDKEREDPETLHYGPKWLPMTYNLQTELPQFVSYYQHRETRGLDNNWICKPWNLARAVDTHITSNLNYIIRLPESGPKIACKYVENPVLFHREDIGASVKFDIRYIILLGSVMPLRLYAYQIFWLRFANKPYSLDNFDDYEKHFTVMNYRSESELKQVHYDEFIQLFESQYPDYPWKDIEESIFQMFRELFQAASSKPFPQGIVPFPLSRAMYAADLLLQWTENERKKCVQPVLCEVNFIPDCDRACKYHPRFVNDVFSALFFDDIENRPVTRLT